MDAFPPPREPHYARLCAYLKTQLTAGPVRQALPGAATATQAAVRARSHAFDAAELLHIERQLAGYIGPLAKHLVKTTASRAAGVEDLVGRLATELDSESARREFTQRCRVGKQRV
jgi:hypothetical protein